MAGRKRLILFEPTRIVVPAGGSRMRPLSIYDFNLVLQLVVFALFLAGNSQVKRKKKNVRKHRLLMGAAVILNAFSIILIMGPSFLNYLGFLVERSREFGPAVTWLYVGIGGPAEVLGASFLFKHPRKTLQMMRLTALLWAAALILGIVFYVYYYIL